MNRRARPKINKSPGNDQPNSIGESGLMVQGLVAGDSAEPEEEIRLLRLALELQRQAGNRSAEANNLGNLTAACLQLGQTREAYEHSREALALYRELGDVMGEAHAMLHNGVAAHRLGRLDEAECHYREALALCDLHNLAHLRAALLSYFARLHLDRGDIATAATAADEAIAACAEIGYSRGHAHALATLGRALAPLGEVDHAVACLRAAAELFGRVGVVGSEDIHTINQEIARITRT
jgi:tetratricopeptide (TPR) repeat protein